MPYKRAAHSITAYNDSILVFGGVGESTLDVLKSDFSTSVSLVAMWKNQGPKKPTRAVGEHATSL
ncbi:MAG: hypothetical protein ACOCQG_05720 [Candidatus Nanoarchaeia archaeon]